MELNPLPIDIDTPTVYILTHDSNVKFFLAATIGPWWLWIYEDDKSGMEFVPAMIIIISISNTGLYLDLCPLHIQTWGLRCSVDVLIWHLWCISLVQFPTLELHLIEIKL